MQAEGNNIETELSSPQTVADLRPTNKFHLVLSKMGDRAGLAVVVMCLLAVQVAVQPISTRAFVSRDVVKSSRVLMCEVCVLAGWSVVGSSHVAALQPAPKLPVAIAREPVA